MRDKDFLMLQEAYMTILEAFNPTPEQQAALDLLDDTRKDLVMEMLQFLSRGATKASFYYKNKGDEAEGWFKVNLGVDYGNIKKQSQDAINAHIATLPAGHADIETASKINTGTKSFFFRVNLASGVSIGMPTPKLPKKQIDALLANPEMKRNYIQEHKDEITIYLMGTVDAKEVVVAGNKEKTHSDAEELKNRLGTRQSKTRTFLLNAKNIAGIKIKGGTIMIQDLHHGEPPVFETREPEQAHQEPEQAHQEPENQEEI